MSLVLRNYYVEHFFFSFLNLLHALQDLSQDFVSQFNPTL
jgi:hypothetical protein